MVLSYSPKRSHYLIYHNVRGRTHGQTCQMTSHAAMSTKQDVSGMPTYYMITYFDSLDRDVVELISRLSSNIQDVLEL